jgi:AcrR family transcriptional regulator
MASEEVRSKIINSATKQFIAHGCRRITMDDVAGELHISKRTLYEYFEKKEDLLMACFEQMKEKVGETICLFKTQCSSPILMALHIYKYLSVYNAQLATLLSDIRDYYPDIYTRLFPKDAPMHTSHMYQTLQAAKEQGDLRPQVDIDLAVQTLTEIIQHFNYNSTKPNIIRMFCEAGYTFVRGLLSVDAIKRYDEQESHIKEMLRDN